MTLNFPANPDDEDIYEDFVYDATKGAWKLQAIPTNFLDQLVDVDVATASSGDYLTYNDSTGNWEPTAPISPIALILALGG